VFFYLRVVVMMYMSDHPSNAPVAAPSTASMIALAVPTVATFYLGLLPARVLELAIESIATIL
jgi:NADH-quinone oxidoreductase subunit N